MDAGRETVLVTGIGFVGTYIVAQLLAEGYRVRGTARGDSLASLKSSIVGQNPSFEAIQVDDIAEGDLSDVLEGVRYVIHTASPLAGHATPADGLKSAVRGTLNVLEQAEKAGISKIVLTSSWATTMNPTLDKMYKGEILSRDDWGTAMEEEVLSGKHDALWNYLASKILAERAAWAFAESHPSIDLTTINPPFIYGPRHPDFPAPTKRRIGGNLFINSLIDGEPGRPLGPQLAPFYCDVRDVARAHVRSLAAPRGSTDGIQKRFLICGGTFTWKEAVEYLALARPGLKGRLPNVENAPPLPGPPSTTDVSPARKILGLEDYIPWKKTVEDTLDWILVAEKKWK
ncbi:NAD-P-binding protein [Mycena vitilis]|nr:NAD-P-binding protein [Mycena vitilis]